MSGRKKKGRRLNSSFVKTTTANTAGSLHTERLNRTQIRANRENLERAQAMQVKVLMATTRQEYAPSDGDEPTIDPDNGWDDVYGDRHLDDVEGEIPLEENGQRTEAGHDGPALKDARREVFASYHHHIRPRRRHDQRTRLQRNSNMHESWTSQTPDLVQAFLEWRHGSAPIADGEPGAPTAEPSTQLHVFEVTAVDIKDRIMYRQVEQRPNERINVALVRAGLLGCSPVDPSVAISLQCLELFHQIRRRQSSFSLQAMAKVLCALHNVTYFQTFRTQLSIAFDVYLDIQRSVQQHINHALGRDTPDWRLLNACPPCGFKLEAEPKLTPERLQSMDGNNLLKRVDGVGHADQRVFPRDYIILPADVDRFKDDVRTRPGTTGSAANEGPPDANGSLPHGFEQTVCTDNWVAANATFKETLQMFEQTGIFVSVCRHGLMQTLVEMRRSGELAKYGLATLNKVLDTFGDDQGMGYDIACSHLATVAASSIAEKARTHRLLLAVNAFHGHAHNLLCQLQHHPLYIPGLGLEDLETCERVFSSSNAVARVVRYSSHFHWHQFIDLHYRQWDEDKYFELSKFLYNNYKQAQAIIAEYTPEIARFKIIHNLEDADFVRWHDEQLMYLLNLKNEPEVDTLSIEYVEALEKLEKAKATYGSVTTVQFQGYSPADLAPTGTLPAASQVKEKACEAERRAAHRKLVLAMNVADNLERRLGLSVRWIPDDEEYRKAAAYLKHRGFVRVVEELERLVVQRLFELAKANLTETGYKMRKHIGNAITRRSQAVHTAVDKYNSLAPLQCPPRPPIEYSAVATYSWLGDFELLKESRHDVLQKPWANPTNREIASKYYKVVRAHKELLRLHVEIARLHTWIDHEDNHLAHTVDHILPSDPLLAGAIRDQYHQRRRVNGVHRERLGAIYRLGGYGGSKVPGVRQGAMDHGQGSGEGLAISPEDQVRIGSDLRGDEHVEVDEDDRLHDKALRYANVMENMMFSWKV